MLDPAAIDAAVLGLLEHDEIPMGTLKKRIEDRAEIADPNVVKVVTDHAGNALYFSPLATSLPHAESSDQRPRASLQNTSASTSTGAIFCWPTPTSPSIWPARTSRTARATARSGKRLPKSA